MAIPLTGRLGVLAVSAPRWAIAFGAPRDHARVVVQVGEIVERLSGEPLRHVVALKMLSAYSEHVRLELREAGAAWAIRAMFPSSVAAYDARVYPAAELVVLLDGSSPSLMQALLDELPAGELVLKTSEPAIVQGALERGGRLERTFLSFTCEASPLVAGPVADGGALDPELSRVFADSGNDLEYLGRCFEHGARWFAIRSGPEVRAACLVYQNFASIWEVAAVFTQPEWRRLGLARRVVAAALRYLRAAQRQPRYQVDAANLASVELARTLGLAEFLRMFHVVMPTSALRRAPGTS